MSTCTDLCQKLHGIRLQHGHLPSHDELIVQLSPLDSDAGWYLGTWRQLQQREQCAFCQLVVAAILDNFEQDGSEILNPNQAVSVLVFPDEQSFRLSYPSRLGTRIAFVADDAAQARGPDTARAPTSTGIDIPRMLKWLQTCCENHAACNEDKNETAEVYIPWPSSLYNQANLSKGVHRNTNKTEA